MTALRPGQSPPPVRTPTLFVGTVGKYKLAWSPLRLFRKGAGCASSRSTPPPRGRASRWPKAAASAARATRLGQVQGGAAFIGDAVERHRAAITAARPDAVFPRRSLFLAGTVALMGEAVLAGGGGRPASQLRPLYLRDADIRKAGG